MDAIHLAINGQSQGPFTRAQVQQKLASGEITADTPAWYEGLAAWGTVSSIMGSAPATVPPSVPSSAVTAAPVTAGAYSQPELQHLGTCQAQLIWAILANIIFNVTVRVVGTNSLIVDLLLFVVGLPIVVFTLYTFYRLAAALRMAIPWVYCILALIPCVSLITAAVLVIKSSKILKEAGIKVGFMGPENIS